jgi:hypothetical protein
VHDTHAGQQQANDITECQHGIWAAILPDFRFATAARRSSASGPSPDSMCLPRRAGTRGTGTARESKIFLPRKKNISSGLFLTPQTRS